MVPPQHHLRALHSHHTQVKWFSLVFLAIKSLTIIKYISCICKNYNHWSFLLNIDLPLAYKDLPQQCAIFMFMAQECMQQMLSWHISLYMCIYFIYIYTHPHTHIYSYSNFLLSAMDYTSWGSDFTCIIIVTTYLLLLIKNPQETNTTKKVERGHVRNTHLGQKPGRIWIQFWYVIHTKRQFAEQYLGHC